MSAGPKYVHVDHLQRFRHRSYAFHPHAPLVFCRFQYLWADGEIIKKPVRLSAPEYVEHLMCWIQAKITDESIFPLETGTNGLFLLGMVE